MVFRKPGGTIFNERTGNRIEVDRCGGVYRLKAATVAKRATATGGTKMPTGLSGKSPRDLRKHNLRHLDACLCHRAGLKSSNTSWHTYCFGGGVVSLRTCQRQRESAP